jgi:16S rRNA (uracil1498-N3)-methyltransferase
LQQIAEIDVLSVGNFDRNLLVDPGILGEVHGPESAAAEWRLNPVFANRLPAEKHWAQYTGFGLRASVSWPGQKSGAGSPESVEFTMHRFYAPGLTIDRETQLPEDESQHLARVLRLRRGDAIVVFDGKGREAIAHVEAVAPRRVTVRATAYRSPAPEAAVAITLGQALLKSDKMERVIRDAVMLGAAAVQPFVSGRTDVPRAAVRSGVRQNRWERTVISSVKQCGRAVVPPVLETREFDDLVGADEASMKVMFVEPDNQDATVRGMASLEGAPPRDALILIGPEGGWNPEEVRQAASAGVKLVTFGRRTLRADAAGAAAIAILQYIWKDL